MKEGRRYTIGALTIAGNKLGAVNPVFSTEALQKVVAEPSLRRRGPLLGSRRGPVGRQRIVDASDAFGEPGIDYVCGRVNFVNESGDNQEGLYWRYEMFLRAQESALAQRRNQRGD